MGFQEALRLPMLARTIPVHLAICFHLQDCFESHKSKAQPDSEPRKWKKKTVCTWETLAGIFDTHLPPSWFYLNSPDRLILHFIFQPLQHPITGQFYLTRKEYIFASWCHQHFQNWQWQYLLNFLSVFALMAFICFSSFF